MLNKNLRKLLSSWLRRLKLWRATLSFCLKNTRMPLAPLVRGPILFLIRRVPKLWWIRWLKSSNLFQLLLPWPVILLWKFAEASWFQGLYRFGQVLLSWVGVSEASNVSKIRASADVQAIKKNFVKKFWMLSGWEFAREIARSKLSKVTFIIYVLFYWKLCACKILKFNWIFFVFRFLRRRQRTRLRRPWIWKAMVIEVPRGMMVMLARRKLTYEHVLPKSWASFVQNLMFLCRLIHPKQAKQLL